MFNERLANDAHDWGDIGNWTSAGLAGAIHVAHVDKRFCNYSADTRVANMMQKLGTSTVPTCQYEKKQLDSSCTYLRCVEALVIWRHHSKDLKHREREREMSPRALSNHCISVHSLF